MSTSLRDHLNCYLLYDTIPYNILEHFSKQKSRSPFDLCEEIVTRHPDWTSRLLDPETDSSLEDRIHDFVGLVNNDDHFVPRI